MNRARSAALPLMLLSFATLADSGPYLGIEAGPNFLTSQDLRLYNFATAFGAVPDGTVASHVKFSNGYLGGLTGGYAFESGFRIELELAHRSNDFRGIRLGNGMNSTVVRGYEMADSAMANVWYSFLPDQWFHPYVGGGAGAIRSAIRNPETSDVSGPLGLAGYDGGSLRSAFDVLFAWQVGGGVEFDFTEHLRGSVGYRFLHSEVGEYDLQANNPNSHVETRTVAHAAVIGLRYQFGAPPPPPPAEVAAEEVAVVPVAEPEAAPPPPPAEPAPCGARADAPGFALHGCQGGEVVVLHGVTFEFNSAHLTPDARVLVDQVADALEAAPQIAVVVQGHTDSRGSAAYNQRLSLKRAQAVKAQLLGRGIEAKRVGTAGFGESQPIDDNATDEGRARNRRVELKIEAAGG